jgi:hypothetical protein
MQRIRGLFVVFSGVLLGVLPGPAQVVINEIHYNPDYKVEPAEFIELHNAGTNAINVAGWYFSDGIDFTLPATNIAAGGYLVVAQNPAFLQSKYGVVGAVGPFKPDGGSELSSRGETITLRNAAGQVVDEVDYQLGFPWPTVGDPTFETAPGDGKSIELIHPGLDNDLAGSWRSAGGGAGGIPPMNTTLLAAQSSWNYVKGTNEASTPATAWRQQGFNDSAWLNGPLPIGYGEAFIATPLNDMRSNYVSVFLRKQFTVANPAQFNSLLLEAQYDDGFKVWINGTMVIDGQANMAPGEAAFNANATAALENAAFVPFTLGANPASVLVAGNNTIAVQIHNASIGGSSDLYFDARLIGQTGGSGGSLPSPGRINTVFATNAPPQTRQVEHTPEEPRGGEPVKITAKVTDPDGVGAVTLQYQIVAPGSYIELTNSAYTNLANWISLPMNDSGASGDAAAGDDTFTAEIPASVQQHRRLIRYRITVTDTGGRSVRVPYADDPVPNFAYFVYNGIPAWTGAVQPGAGGSNGTLRTITSNEMARLPAFHLISKSNLVADATWFSRYGGDLYNWQGTLVYDGKVYDHIRYRARGGVWRYSMVKNMWKFDLNRGHDIEIRDNWGRKFKTAWTKVNLGANIQQRDFWHRGEQGMLESVGFRVFQLADVAAPNSAFVTFRVIDDALEQDPGTQFEGDFWGMYLCIEQENGRFLEEHDLPDSNLYKMEGGTGELNNLGPSGPTDKSDLNYILGNYTAKPESWWRTNWNLPRYYSYQAAAQAIHHYDICYDKNFFYYYNPSNRLWEICTWDLDLTWANNMYDAGCRGADRVYQRIFDEISPAKPNIRIEWNNRMREFRDLFWNSDEAHKLIEEYATLLRGTNSGPNILDADRMMWDYNPKMASSVYSQTLSKAGQGEYYQFSQERMTNAALQGSFNAGVQIMKNYVGIRGTFLDNLAVDAAKPARPTITYTGPSGYPLNRLTFRSSTYSGANPFGSMRWRVGEITDTNSPNYRADEPRKYEIETVWDSGPLSPFNADITVPANVLRVGGRYRVRVRHTDSTGRDSQWSLAHEFTCGEPLGQTDLIDYLRITEVMFNPPPAGYEFIELHNTSTTVTLDLAGVKFTQGVDYTFPPGATLAPGAYLLVVGTLDVAGFRAWYGLDESVAIYGPYDGGLNNGGENLTLRTAAGGTDIVEFNYRDGRGWPPQADGSGHSLVLRDGALGAQNTGSGEYSGNWRPSTFLRGSAGRADALPAPTVLLNEIVAHTDFTNALDSNDWIELYNPTDNPITLGPNWYLSDDGDVLTKWMIPPATMIPARGWVSFDEVTGFHNPTNIGFGLSKGGEQVFLSYLPGTAQDRVVDAVSFKGQENDWSLGRWPDGAPHWHALNPRTRDTTNAPPPARVVISEVLYHPPDTLEGTNLVDNTLDEFIELRNATPGPVTLHNTNGTWRLDGGVAFTFPTNLTLAPDEYLLVVNFNPMTNAAQLAAFKALYNVTDPMLRILGPYGGKLANDSDRVALERPQAGELPGDGLNWVIVDEVIYADQAPWSCGTDGTGNSHQRVAMSAHGSDPANWSGEAPTAGRPRLNLPAGVPAITTPPQDRIVGTNGNVSFSVSVCGAPPFTYQWLFEGGALPNATNDTLNLFNVTLAQAGGYSVIVSNSAGGVTSVVATLIVQLPPVITTQPAPVTTVRDQPAAFTVDASGTPPLLYQWRFNGANLPGATNQTLTLTAVQTNQAGHYSVLVFNSAGSTASSNAALTVLVPATITQQPTNISVFAVFNTNTMAYNPTNKSFTAAAVGVGSLRHQWRFNGADLPGETNTTLTVSNITPASAGGYSLRVTDDIGPTTSQTALLNVFVEPVFLISPVTQGAAPGANVTFSASFIAYPPPYTTEWRRSSTPVSSNVGGLTTSFFIITNAQAFTAGTYRTVVRNPAKPGGNATPFATLSVLADADGDGIPDAWENNFGFSPTNSMDATNDWDGDTLSNWQEYVAGTDPTNGLSYLKVERVLAGDGVNGQARLEFQAVSNRTYTVLWSDRAQGGAWGRVADVPATATNRPVQLWDTSPPNGPFRFYRLATPQQP